MDLVCVAFPAGRIDDVIAFLDPLVGPVRRAGRRCLDFIRSFTPLISLVNLPPSRFVAFLGPPRPRRPNREDLRCPRDACTAVAVIYGCSCYIRL